eukprot:TRINITY_DN30151_c0_g1_i1.p1 TRINITY_DN30151_c0_g1~~TRINITY_DN30151_c0_g1_i1.p1  ORF type:complete len:166 (-),score=47.54 TRINITY_DN30151_c0_g1_i1:56-553(-)
MAVWYGGQQNPGGAFGAGGYGYDGGCGTYTGGQYFGNGFGTPWSNGGMDSWKGDFKGKGKAAGGGKGDSKKSWPEEDIEAEMMAGLEQDQERAVQAATAVDDGASDDGDPLPPSASEAEVEEARRIVQQATKELEERKKMQAKVSAGCSQNDLQAMINARLAGKR